MKNIIKKSILEKRNSLSKDDIFEKSKLIKKNLFNLDQYKDSRSVMFFVSFDSEVHTHEMIEESLGKKTVVVPKILNRQIEPSVIIDFGNLVPGKFQIMEPIELMKIADKNIGLVIVPGTVFDKKGHRIGFGYGFYDKFLARVPKAIKIGLCFDFQVVDKIPSETHDIPVDLIVTEKRVIECRK